MQLASESQFPDPFIILSTETRTVFDLRLYNYGTKIPLDNYEGCFGKLGQEAFSHPPFDLVGGKEQHCERHSVSPPSLVIFDYHPRSDSDMTWLEWKRLLNAMEIQMIFYLGREFYFQVQRQFSEEVVGEGHLLQLFDSPHSTNAS